MKINSEKYYTVTIDGKEYKTTGAGRLRVAKAYKAYGVKENDVRQGAVLGVLDWAPAPETCK